MQRRHPVIKPSTRGGIDVLEKVGACDVRTAIGASGALGLACRVGDGSKLCQREGRRPYCVRRAVNLVACNGKNSPCAVDFDAELVVLDRPVDLPRAKRRIPSPLGLISA